jgi:hypothetical protein
VPSIERSELLSLEVRACAQSVDLYSFSQANAICENLTAI